MKGVTDRYLPFSANIKNKRKKNKKTKNFIQEVKSMEDKK